MPDHWRLLLSGAKSGAENMALDEAVLRSVERGESPPTVRFYGWSPACVSLGRLQSAEGFRPEALHKLGLDVVRRPTGGRALLHDDEVTYSAVAHVDACPSGTDVMSTYRWVSSGLIAGLAKLGVSARLADRRGRFGQGATALTASRGIAPCGRRPAHRRRPQGAVPRGDRGMDRLASASCLASAARCDLVVGTRKLIGSAQKRGAGAFLQQGSLPLSLNRQRLTQVLGPTGDPGEAATDLSSLVGRVSAAEVATALSAGLAEALRIELCEGTLTTEETSAAADLATHKYNHLW